MNKKIEYHLAASLMSSLRLSMLAFFFLLLAGCTLLPGMQNIGTPTMQLETMGYSRPVVIPITESLLASIPKPRYVYHIGRQDILNIVIWQPHEFDKPLEQFSRSQSNINRNQNTSPYNYTINPDGTLYFPLVGYLKVEGQSINHVRNRLSYRLRRYIKNPQVNISIAEYKSQKVYVLGEINNPGVLYLNNEAMSIMDALMLSSSIDQNTGDPRFIYVIRGDMPCPKIYWLNANTPDRLILAEHFYLQNNDIVYVSPAVVTRWNRFLSQLLPTVETIYFTKAITHR